MRVRTVMRRRVAQFQDFLRLIKIRLDFILLQAGGKQLIVRKGVARVCRETGSSHTEHWRVLKRLKQSNALNKHEAAQDV